MPRSTSSFLVPRSSTPTLSPAWALSSSLRNISMAVAVVLRVSRRPTISTSDIVLMTPRSTRPVTTVPRPSMLNTSSMHIRKGLSCSRTGSGTNVSRALSRLAMAASPSGVPAMAAVADPRMIGVLSPGKPYLLSRSMISISMSSRRSASARSTLLRNTTMLGTPTWRARRMCSRVWGIGPSAALTTRMAPSIWAAPVIMFLT